MDSKKKKSKRDKERSSNNDGLKKIGGVKYDTVVDRQVFLSGLIVINVLTLFFFI
jgi:hypothetical protein